MNIVYLLTNLDKKEDEMRFYVGSKQECHIENINGRDTIVSDHTHKPYWGSSSNSRMREDLKNCTFEASILASTGHRNQLLALEQEWIEKLNAVESLEYYNLSNARLRGGMLSDKGNIVNRFGEQASSFAGIKSSFMKRHNGAVAIGFESFGHMVLDISQRRKAGQSLNTIAQEYSKMCGKYVAHCRIKNVSRYFDIPLLEVELEKVTPEEIKTFRDLCIENASILKICELTGYSVPTVSYFISDVMSANKHFTLAIRRQQTPEELETQVLKEVLDGLSVAQASRKLQITEASGNRYFYRALRKRLKSSDL
jgi:hypothetical protein